MKSVALAAAMSKSELSGAGPVKPGAVFLSTWPHGKPANEHAALVFEGGGNLLDAVERGINLTENDPAITSVGYGGLPNEDGIVELDAALMDGTRHHAGAVASLRNIRNPISVARQVLEQTRHTTLAGEGAFQFALKMGFHAEQLLTPESLKRWMDWKADPHRQSYWKISAENHDTIGMVATDGRGHVVCGCSTSGAAWKISGRVGDSPLVGCGIYADDHVGAASATGDGDLMTNYCTSVSIVHYMAQGMSPQQACEELLKHMAVTDPHNQTADAAVIAMNSRGEVGAASMRARTGFKYAVLKNGESQLLQAAALY
ncbi:MAG TPA: N(4)-(beta-N-acetylglucosaminyl)-L-asparaginase [Terriglobia bacterium]|nr:N(4)-(beta-N-acetylglucosaminyl)-L-asparaginase [Terriglobia bacterium]